MPPETRPGQFHRIVVVLLLAFGGQLALVIGGGAFPLRFTIQWVLITAVLAAMIARNRPFEPRFRRLQPLLARCGAKFAFATALFVCAGAYLYFTSARQHRAFMPIYQDEFSYLLQARLLTSGRLWIATHPLADFFESFQIVVRPVYGSIYFPGASMLYSIGLFLHFPTWLTPLLLSAACAVLIHRIATDFLPPILGLCAPFLLIGLTIFRLQSVMTMAQIPVLLAGLLTCFAWLRWRTNHARGWLVLIGVACGFAAVTRPVDAICFALPVMLAIAMGRTNFSIGGAARDFFILLAAAAPFAVVQLIFNFGVTGSLVHTPFGDYARTFYPQTQYGFHGYDSSIRPQSTLPQKIAYYDRVVVPNLLTHTALASAKNWRQRFPALLISGLPHAILIAFIPLGFMRLRRPELLVVAAPLFIFPILYWPYAFFLPHYTLTVAPAVIFLALSGADVLAGTFHRFRRSILVGTGVVLAGTSIVELPEGNRANFDEFFPAAQVQTAARKLAALPDEPAIVLFTWRDGCNPEEEPVYNLDRADIDANRIIRAHDLGERNQLLFDYYALRQPDRLVYRYDRGDDSITLIDRVGDLGRDSVRRGPPP